MIGNHTRPNKGANDTWLTPPAIIRELGPFDLDPCPAPLPRPWDTASKYIDFPHSGLMAPWSGRVWLNPPYSSVDFWIERMAQHRDGGIALVFARTETQFWTKWIWPFCSGVLFISGRLHFHFPDGSRAAGNSGGPSALIAYGEDNMERLRRSSITGSLASVISRSGR